MYVAHTKPKAVASNPVLYPPTSQIGLFQQFLAGLVMAFIQGNSFK